MENPTVTTTVTPPPSYQTGTQFSIPSIPPPGFAGIRARVLMAFDVDGTIETSPPGPISVQRLTQLHSQYPYVVVVIVSPSAKAPPGFPNYSQKGDRLACLLAVRRDYPADVYLYISDNKDQPIARQAGFSYIEAADFI